MAYKYCDLHGIDILANLELKITPPNQFNDPFEFTPYMICTNPLRKATEMLKNRDTQRQLFEILKSVGKIHGSFREFKDSLRFNGSKVAKGLSDAYPQVAAIYQKESLDRMSALIGILCMSKRRDSILMWGHYADKNRGLVIGFDRANPVFQPISSTPLREVEYSRKRVLYDASWPISDPRVLAYEDQITFTKNEDWRYEQELRQLFRLSSLSRKLLDDSSQGYFLPVPADALLTVTLGPKVQAEFAQRVRAALAKPAFSHIKFDRAVLHDSEFQLAFERVT